MNRKIANWRVLLITSIYSSTNKAILPIFSFSFRHFTQFHSLATRSAITQLPLQNTSLPDSLLDGSPERASIALSTVLHRKTGDKALWEKEPQWWDHLLYDSDLIGRVIKKDGAHTCSCCNLPTLSTRLRYQRYHCAPHFGSSCIGIALEEYATTAVGVLSIDRTIPKNRCNRKYSEY